MSEQEQHSVDEQDIKELEMSSFLSKREAELFLLYQKHDEIKKSAEKMGISENTAYSYWRSVKDKVRKSRDTVELAGDSLA